MVASKNTENSLDIISDDYLANYHGYSKENEYIIQKIFPKNYKWKPSWNYTPYTSPLSLTLWPSTYKTLT